MLRSVDDVLSELLADARPVAGAQCALAEALGTVLAEDVCAPIDVPPADNSAMDGYAIRLDDYLAGAELPISQRIAAGARPVPLAAGTVARIFTGAELPLGADCVIAQEDCVVAEAGVSFNSKPVAGQHVRPRGQDIARGQRVLAAGRRLRAMDLGLLASLGIGTILVRGSLRVALLSTGDELLEPGQSLLPGKIYNSNRPMLAALIRGLGAQVVDIGIVGDTPAATRQALERACCDADVVISSGGVSVGEEDHVKAQVEALGRLSLWKLAIKPGKPLAYGWLPGRTAVAGEVPFFGLPGNPVSAFVTFALLVRPYLLRMLGSDETAVQLWPARADFDWPRAGSRQEYLRARINQRDGELWAELYPQQSSGALSSVVWCDALVVVPVAKTLKCGDTVHFISMKELLS